MNSSPENYTLEKRTAPEISRPFNQRLVVPGEPEKGISQNEQHSSIPSAPNGHSLQTAGGQETSSVTVVDEAERNEVDTWKDPGPPPDGGVVAWTQALMTHLIIFNTWGFVNSFGVFQSYYTVALHRSPSDVSWIGSLQIFLLFAVGTFSGRALDAGLFRIVLFAGCLILVFGMFMTSLCTQYWQAILAHGICVGIGNGLIFCPCISVVSTYFSKNKSFAMGFAAAGSATGGIVYPIIVQQLLPKVGFGWTVRVLAFVTLATTALANIFMRSRIPPRKSGPLIEMAAFKEAPYVLYCVATFLNFWGLYFAFFYIGAFARDVIKLSYTESIDLVIIINAVGYVGRIVPAILADRYVGAVNAITPCAFCAGILLYSWSGVHDKSSLIAFCVIYGLFSSGVQSMFAVALASLTSDLSKTGTRMGMCFTIVSFATLTGEPIAGALISERGGDYFVAQMWGGTVVIASSLVLVAARVAKTGFVFKARV